MIIGLCGHQGAGKSTVCETAINIVSPTGKPFARIGFSDPLYKMLEAMGIPGEIVHNKKRWEEPLDILCGRSTRFACDKLGNDYGREIIGKYVWTRLGIERARALNKQGYHVIIDNVRYENEAKAIIDNGGVIISFEAIVSVDFNKPSEREIPGIQIYQCKYAFMNTKKDLEQDAIKFASLLDKIVKECDK